MEVQEIASACRFGVALMGRGWNDGPRLSQVRLDTLFVRDGDFLYDLAKQMVREGEDIVTRWAELRRDNSLADEENITLRKLRSEAVIVASEVVDVARHLQRNYPKRWANWEKMMKKQTLRQIMRKTKSTERAEVTGDIRWCAEYIVNALGSARLEKLLTLRSEMA